jgi:hypothetical protein
MVLLLDEARERLASNNSGQARVVGLHYSVDFPWIRLPHCFILPIGL